MIVFIKDLSFEIDDDVYESIKNNYSFHIHKSKSKTYIRAYCLASKKKFYLHRLIIGNIPNGFDVDHIDSNGLNNKRSNLRTATRSQNNANRIDNGSKGVHFEKSTGKYRAMIWKDNKKYSIGRFNTFDQAKSAYSNKALELFGEYKNSVMVD